MSLDLELLQVGNTRRRQRIAGATVRIGEAARASGLGIETIRYYEKAGILPPIARASDGQRRFSQEDVEWMTLLYWLRETGMPMKVMHRYAQMVHAGEHTIPARKAILQEHGRRLRKRREALDRCRDLLAYKLAAYDEAEGGGPR